MKSRSVFGVLIVLSLVLAASAAATPEPTQTPIEVPVEPTAMPEPTVMPEPQPIDIDDTAVADGRFITFVVAL